MSDRLKEQQKIIIVDDIAKNIQVAASILQDYDLNISFADNGKKALDIIRSREIDLILLDIMMPEMDGFEVCRQLKEDKATAHIPVIFLTAKTDTESIVKGFELGASDYVNKPFNPQELVARVKTHLKLKHMTDSLKASEKRLMEANAAKDKFFTIIAHDLKAPFTGIIGFNQLLLSKIGTISSEKIKSYVEKSLSSTKMALNLLENLLAWARSQTGKIEADPEDIDLDDLLQDVHMLLNNIAQAKKIDLKVDTETAITIHADREMLFTVLRNLISNSLKYTPECGSVNVTAVRNGNETEITVFDTGVGIHKEDIPKLFRIDITHSTPGTDQEKGTGLGLLICKEFIEKNNGNICIESEPGKGTKFTINLLAAEITDLS